MADPCLLPLPWGVHRRFPPGFQSSSVGVDGGLATPITPPPARLRAMTFPLDPCLKLAGVTDRLKHSRACFAGRNEGRLRIPMSIYLSKQNHGDQNEQEKDRSKGSACGGRIGSIPSRAAQPPRRLSGGGAERIDGRRCAPGSAVSAAPMRAHLPDDVQRLLRGCRRGPRATRWKHHT